jgi:hypothetical protein
MNLRRRIVTAALAASLALTITMAGMTPAGAGFSCLGTEDELPDGKINVNGGPFFGAGEVNFARANAVVNDGQTALYRLRWKNKSATTQKIRLYLLDRPDNDEIGAKYFADGEDITRFFRQEERLTFRGVPAGKSIEIWVVLKNKPGAEPNPDREIAINGRYAGTPSNYCDRLLPSMND